MPRPPTLDLLKLLSGQTPAYAPEPGLACYILDQLDAIKEFLLCAGVFDVYQTAVAEGKAQARPRADNGETTVTAPIQLGPLPANPQGLVQGFGLLVVFLNDHGADIDATLLVHLCDRKHRDAAIRFCLKALGMFLEGYPAKSRSLQMINSNRWRQPYDHRPS